MVREQRSSLTPISAYPGIAVSSEVQLRTQHLSMLIKALLPSDNDHQAILERLDEMLDETLAIEEDEELEEEADAEVDKVLFDLTNGKLGLAGSVQTEPPVRPTIPSSLMSLKAAQTLEDKLEDEETERVMEQYRQQLSGLLS